ncbi:MAG: ribosomal protein L7/L12 [Anaerolineae bacterium]|jgi:ribosomal protein L7/L12|nr:ribosomal protein L7/L12 [Anaerolineae bacterium]
MSEPMPYFVFLMESGPNPDQVAQALRDGRLGLTPELATEFAYDPPRLLTEDGTEKADAESLRLALEAAGAVIEIHYRVEVLPCDVILRDAGANQIQVIAILRQFGYNYKDAWNATCDTPCLLFDSQSHGTASAIKHQLEQVGAKVELVPLDPK